MQNHSFKQIAVGVEELGVDVAKVAIKEVSRWPALVALLLIGAGYSILSERLTVGPSWLFLLIVLGLTVPVVIMRVRGNHGLAHQFLLVVISLATLSEVASIVLLIASLPDKTIIAASLLRDAGLLWASNVGVFALWYWQVDAGGPFARSHESCQNYRLNAELVFPQLTLIGERPKLELWRPSFTDYLFVAFNTSTAFSPTDTPVLSSRIKWLSMLQSLLSLVTLATLAARAINIL